MAQTSAYPAALDTDTLDVPKNVADKALAAVIAVEAALGIDPAGTEDTVVARLAAIEGRLDALEA